MNITQTRAVLLADVQQTQQLGHMLGRSLPANSIVLLEGDLGSGKTSLVQGIGLGLGITDPIVSPTFTLVNEYLEGRLPLYHFDLYRLEPAEVRSLFIETYWSGIDYPPGLVAIEWADRLKPLPPSYLKISLQHLQEGRRVVLETVGPSMLDAAFWDELDAALQNVI